MAASAACLICTAELWGCVDRSPWLGFLRSQRYLTELDSAALFWDVACVPQKPPSGRRRFDEQQSFDRALKQILALYASASGTCVLTNGYVPPPEVHAAGYELCVVVSSLVDGDSEILRDALRAMGGPAPTDIVWVHGGGAGTGTGTLRGAGGVTGRRTSFERTNVSHRPIHGGGSNSLGGGASAELTFASSAEASAALDALTRAGFAAAHLYNATPFAERGPCFDGIPPGTPHLPPIARRGPCFDGCGVSGGVFIL